MTNITNIPLHQLTAWDGNVRKTQNKGFIEELAASIKAHGLQQNLVVRKDGRKYAVVAGGQRLKALKLLLTDGHIKANYPVPCKILDSDTEASELSLAENVVRAGMHPADQFEAFRALVDRGNAVADVAARFGVTETVVAQRLKLARVSAAILKAYRKEELNLEQVMAFAVSDDHAAQERVLKDIAPWSEAGDIRAALTENDIAATDKRVKFVTLKAYEAAGGTTRRDLFSEDDDSVFILDADLLHRLVREKLERAAKSVRKEGWKWVEVHIDFGYEARGEFHRRYPEFVTLSPEAAAELQQLEDEYDRLCDVWNDENNDDAERPERLDEVQAALEKLKEQDEFWPAETLAIAGAVVTIGYNGKADIERGLVRHEDAPKKTKPAKSGETAGGKPTPDLSAALIESLTTHKSAALSAELLFRPDVALAAVIYTFARRTAFDEHVDSSLAILFRTAHLRGAQGSKACADIEFKGEAYMEAMPDTSDQLWKWCLEQEQTVLLDLLAYFAAISLNAVHKKVDLADSSRLQHANALASALSLDMKDWFTPTAENYFSRVGKSQILEALREAKGRPPAPAWEKLKKAELAKLAEREIAGTGWMPVLLR